MEPRAKLRMRCLRCLTFELSGTPPVWRREADHRQREPRGAMPVEVRSSEGLGGILREAQTTSPG
jgi:hypothetical protein